MIGKKAVKKRIFAASAALLAFAFGYAIVCFIVSLLVPPLHVRKVSEKLEAIRARSEEIDVIFVGSSRTAMQIVPSVFDSTMAAAGLPVTSFNLGFEGVRPPEDTMLLEQALKNRRRPLKFLVAECNAVKSMMEDEDKWTTRMIYTHDRKRLGVYWRHIWSPRLGKPFELDDYLRYVADHSVEFIDHFRHFLWNYGRLSEGAGLLQQALTGQPARKKSKPSPPDGFYPADSDWEPLQGNELKRYQKNLEKRRKTPAERVFEDQPSQDDIAAKKAMAERFGATLVLVSPPYLRDYTFMPMHKEHVIHLDFSEPNDWPEFYKAEARRDYGHLNDEASREFTRILAEKIAKAYSQRS